MVTRRELLLAATAATLTPSTAKALTSTPTPKTSANTRPPGQRTWTPDGVTLPVVVKDGVKVMHLVAEEVDHEFCAGLKAKCWGYNGRTVGPTIEVVEGDSLRIYVTNKLPEPTTVHWHGITLPNGMDGVAGLTQAAIPVGATFKYEFVVEKAGTFMYHPHFDEMTQMAMGMMGMFIVLPKKEASPVDHDVVMMLSEWSIPAGGSRPNPLAMNDFNVLTINSKAYPGTSPVVVTRGQKVRFRIGNLSAMDHHSMHLHAFAFNVVATDGGLVPPSARFPETTTLVQVGSTKTIEFVADVDGDWAFHCHMTHHGMNQMGHGIPSLIGADLAAAHKRLARTSPSVMLMGENGMGGMHEMHGTLTGNGMKFPANSIPMLGGDGPFGAIEMGGMFTLVKVRSPGHLDDVWYQHPAGTVASAATAEELARDGIAPDV